jgi:hypothetical protein
MGTIQQLVIQGKLAVAFKDIGFFDSIESVYNDCKTTR